MTAAMAHREAVRMSEVITPAFYDFWEDSREQKHLRYVLKGGRNSGKSTQIGFRILWDIMRYPISGLVVRKVGNTMAESVFEQLKECASIMGVYGFFDFKVSPLQIIYRERGNKILFRGADKPEKIKSLKVSRFPVARLWIEELAEFQREEDIDTIEQSVLRNTLPEGLSYQFYYSYNPPKRKQSWVNKKYNGHGVSGNTFVHHSTYLENPYISQETAAEAEELKKKNETKYRWIFLGEPVGSGVVPFSNLVFRTITAEEVSRSDNIRQGCDWGYATDPLAFVRLQYDKTRKRILFLDEVYRVKLFNREFAAILKSRGYDTQLTIADSEDPKSVAELKKDYGCRFTGAKKGPGSVEYGENWLDDLDEIIIDPARTPNVAREFESIDYATDRNGDPLPRLEDKDNHTIDATRYALEGDMGHKGGISFLK